MLYANNKSIYYNILCELCLTQHKIIMSTIFYVNKTLICNQNILKNMAISVSYKYFLYRLVLWSDQFCCLLSILKLITLCDNFLKLDHTIIL